MILRGLNIVFRFVFELFGMMFMLFEEILWVGFGGLWRQIGRLAPIALAEDWVRRLPPILALPLFVLPWLIMLPVKLLALWLIAIGKVGKGVALFIGGEAFGVAFLARLYELCRPALRQWRWFVIVERIILRWTHWSHRVFNNLPLVRSAHGKWVEFSSEIERRFLVFRQKIKPPKL